MFEERDPQAERLQSARETVQTFMKRKNRAALGLMVATLAAEAVFAILMLCFMDFHSQLYWFLLFGFLLIYVPVILFSWHNSVKIDHVYYRLLDELKYSRRE